MIVGNVDVSPRRKTKLVDISVTGQLTLGSDTSIGGTNALLGALTQRFSEIQGEDQETRLASRKLWPWLLMAALAIVLFEWWVYNRKVYL